jgi:hypothetical protein
MLFIALAISLLPASPMLHARSLKADVAETTGIAMHTFSRNPVKRQPGVNGCGKNKRIFRNNHKFGHSCYRFRKG